jgi:hypothetical protein
MSTSQGPDRTQMLVGPFLLSRTTLLSGEKNGNVLVASLESIEIIVRPALEICVSQARNAFVVKFLEKDVDGSQCGNRTTRNTRRCTLAGCALAFGIVQNVRTRNYRRLFL